MPLAERFVHRFCRQYGKPLLKLSESACQCLTSHPWQGNIRELEHAIEKAVIIGDGPCLSAEQFSLSRETLQREDTPTEASTLEEMERQMIQKALAQGGNNLSAVAAGLGITRQTLYNKMKKYGF